MKRYEHVEGDCWEAEDGEWMRYTDHVEAMKRIAGAPVAEPVAWHIGNADGSINKIGAVYIRRSLAEKHIESYEGELDACIVPLYAAPAPSASRGEVVVTWDDARTRILAVTRQDDEGQILSVMAEAPSASPVYDQSVVKRIATQMGWTPPSAAPAALTDDALIAVIEKHFDHDHPDGQRLLALARDLAAASPADQVDSKENEK